MFKFMGRKFKWKLNNKRIEQNIDGTYKHMYVMCYSDYYQNH